MTACSIEARGLVVRHPGQPRCLDGVDVRADAGEFVAVVGATGSGKTTLINAVLGLVDIEDGQLLVDGRPLLDADVALLRSLVAVSSSDAVLFDMTVADNIRFGEPLASDDEVRRAVAASAADDFVEALADGYDTKIGERGTRLSTGQRQRLALARALVRRPSLLLLDEATSGLDGPTERTVMRRLLSRADRPTILMVTHRLYALEQADRIYVLSGGRVAEQGSHRSLLAHGGEYRRLCEEQGLVTDSLSPVP